MMAIRNGKILEQIKIEGYKVVAREGNADGIASWIAIKIFKGKQIVFPYELPESIKMAADALYKKYHQECKNQHK